jgi:hypothetical protein
MLNTSYNQIENIAKAIKLEEKCKVYTFSLDFSFWLSKKLTLISNHLVKFTCAKTKLN